VPEQDHDERTSRCAFLFGRDDIQFIGSRFMRLDFDADVDR